MRIISKNDKIWCRFYDVFFLNLFSLYHVLLILKLKVLFCKSKQLANAKAAQCTQWKTINAFFITPLQFKNTINWWMAYVSPRFNMYYILFVAIYALRFSFICWTFAWSLRVIFLSSRVQQICRIVHLWNLSRHKIRSIRKARYMLWLLERFGSEQM